MIQKEISEQCDAMFKQIKDAEDKLKELRIICQHPNTFEGNYSFRVGSIAPAVICSDCKNFINFK